MTSQVRLNRYERGIVEALTAEHGYAAEEARALVVRYVHVIRKLGAYDAPRDHAERISEAHRSQYPPEAWLERLIAGERDLLRGGVLPAERSASFAYGR
ncbi:hypothetical protein [Cohnella nanjingensis]|uniref:Uncharacterized protein n=1 Tax=Cohnella nanjingensis TaxID=1387779 RepID=A0A7X0VKE0_9BACL|nr:hypothetical protein [Cohnella nanjingensis]MBB6675654.1 hypothetical protein [Cohnella nanjingensis]